MKSTRPRVVSASHGVPGTQSSPTMPGPGTTEPSTRIRQGAWSSSTLRSKAMIASADDEKALPSPTVPSRRWVR